MRSCLFSPIVFAVLLSACGETNDPFDVTFATVTFVYEAATTIDPTVQNDHPGCVNGVGQTHIHPGWRSFDRVNMAAAQGRWEITFTDVPVDTENRIY